MKRPFISRIQIQNFRNFLSVDLSLNSKQVLFGENESGKTNFLFALQLILDPSLSDNDRTLQISDYNTSIVNPMESLIPIIISIYISNFEESKTLLAQFSDALVNIDGNMYINITYKYFPEIKEDGSFQYNYVIYKGKKEDNIFGSRDRSFLQLKVIRPLRDVEYELSNKRSSPIIKLVDRYNIKIDQLENIANAMKAQSDNLLQIDELIDLRNTIETRLSQMLGSNQDSHVSISMAEIAPERLITSLRLLLSGRDIEEKSLGIKNVLFITLLLLVYHDKTVPSFLDEREYVKLSEYDKDMILATVFHRTPNGNYVRDDAIITQEIEDFFIAHQKIGQPEVIIAIEEPEAHLHPILQRLVFRDVINEYESSIILTTHSPNIASIVPLDYMIHVRKERKNISKIHSSFNLNLTTSEKKDIERYIDVNRGELYFGKSILLVEGIAEEYLIPQFASILKTPFDQNGVVMCRIDSTNFVPYSVFLSQLDIPHVILTDGDYFETDVDGNEIFHIDQVNTDKSLTGFLGIEIIKRLLASRSILFDSNIEDKEIRALGRKNNIFVGEHTLEVDIMKASILNPDAIDAICNSYNELCLGGELQRKNFRAELLAGEYNKCLAKIESRGIGKGRYSQRFAQNCTYNNIPNYIKDAVRCVIQLGQLNE